VNALSNLAFLIAAYAAFDLWRREGRDDPAILALIVIVVAVGLGSFAFHTLARRGAMLLDVTPIGLFIYGYLLLALRRFLLLSWPASLALLAGFIVLSLALASYVPRAVGQAMLVAAALFGVSLIFRIADLDACAAWPLGTHFLWHVLNAAVLYAVLRGAIAERQHPLGQERK